MNKKAIVIWHQSKITVYKIKFVLTQCPHEQEQSPEVILNGCWIFSVKFEYVPNNDSEVNEQNHLQNQHIFDQKLKIAQKPWKRSIAISNQSWNLKKIRLSSRLQMEKITFGSIQFCIFHFLTKMVSLEEEQIITYMDKKIVCDGCSNV